LRRVILAICATAAALVLLLSFKTHTQASAPSAAIASPTPGSGTPSAGPAGSAPAGGSTGKTVDGTAWPTVYGPVQVQVTVKDGRITAASAPEYPQETPRDEQINAYAIPQLNAETRAADSAKIDAVSGATYTSQGYIASLQSALDKAGLS
jgi:major membrane immunogen (membrane-anchored lipoprotein)